MLLLRSNGRRGVDFSPIKRNENLVVGTCRRSSLSKKHQRKAWKEAPPWQNELPLFVHVCSSHQGTVLLGRRNLASYSWPALQKSFQYSVSKPSHSDQTSQIWLSKPSVLFILASFFRNEGNWLHGTPYFLLQLRLFSFKTLDYAVLLEFCFVRLSCFIRVPFPFPGIPLPLNI